MGKDSRMCGCADVWICRFNQHLNMWLVELVVVVVIVVVVELFEFYLGIVTSFDQIRQFLKGSFDFQKRSMISKPQCLVSGLIK